MLIRTPSENDRRTTDVQLTEKGKNAAQEARIQREERHIQMFACLSDEEKSVLLSLLEKVNAAWDRQYRTDEAGQQAAMDRKGCARRHQSGRRK